VVDPDPSQKGRPAAPTPDRSLARGSRRPRGGELAASDEDSYAHGADEVGDMAIPLDEIARQRPNGRQRLDQPRRPVLLSRTIPSQEAGGPVS
jgi:hypothetical protein